METEEDVLATMSHELRGPLNAILGWVQLLRAAGTCGPEAERALEIIERNARQEARAVDDAIDLARLASGRVTVKRNETRWVEALRAALAAHEIAAGARGIRIDVEADHQLRVVGDLGRLVQIARGLVGSAVRRSVAGGIVQVRLLRDGADAVLWVREDRGAERSLLPIDDPRDRATARHRRAQLIGEPRGLDFVVAKGLLRVHGGTLEEDAGTARMIARLPLAPSTTRVPAAAPARVRV